MLKLAQREQNLKYMTITSLQAIKYKTKIQYTAPVVKLGGLGEAVASAAGWRTIASLPPGQTSPSGHRAKTKII